MVIIITGVCPWASTVFVSGMLSKKIIIISKSYVYKMFIKCLYFVSLIGGVTNNDSTCFHSSSYLVVVVVCCSASSSSSSLFLNS